MSVARPTYQPKRGFLLDTPVERITEKSDFLKAIEFKQLVLPRNAVAIGRKEQRK